jgi:hypothetical protein
MRLIVCLLLLGLPLFPRDAAQIEQDLDRIAHTATVMVDGDVCQHLLTARALQRMLHADPRDQWADADNYDVDDQSFIATKKTLIRLSRLVDYPVDINLWMPIDGMADRIHIVIRNRYEMSQFWTWGSLTQPMPEQMRSILQGGHRRVAVRQKPDYLSVLAPIHNSLGDTVALVEVVTKQNFDARENVK